MKKLLIAIAATLTLIMTSCGGTDIKSLDEKFDKGDANTTFTQDEYEAMVSYLEEICSNPEKIQKAMESENPNDEVASRMVNYSFALAIAKSEGKLDASTLEKYQKAMEESQKILELQQN